MILISYLEREIYNMPISKEARYLIFKKYILALRWTNKELIPMLIIISGEHFNNGKFHDRKRQYLRRRYNKGI